MQKACFLLRCSLFSQNSFAKIIISVRFFVILPSKLIMFIIHLKTSSKDGSAYRFPRGLYLTVSQTACLSCRFYVLLCVLIRVPFRKLIIDNSLLWQSGNVALWHFSVLHFHFMPVFAISLLYPTVATPAGDDIPQSRFTTISALQCPQIIHRE